MLPKNLPTAYTAECLFDSRVVERHIAEGRTTQVAYEEAFGFFWHFTQKNVERWAWMIRWTSLPWHDWQT